MNVFHQLRQLRGVVSPARRPTRPLARDARTASATPEAARRRCAVRRRPGAIPTPFSLWVVRLGLALAVITLLAPLPVTLSVMQTVVSPVRWSLATLILMVGSAALAATVAAVLTVRANAPDARANVTFIALGGMCLFALLCFAGLLVPATRTDALVAGMVGFAVLSTGAVVWSPWFGGTWGAILACLLIWGNVICFPLTLPSATLTTYALAGLLTASLITILLAREQTKRTAWARSSTQIIGNLGLSATQVTAMLLLLLVGWVVAIPLLTTAQWRPATHALAAARERLSQANPLTTPGASGPTVAAFGVIKSAPTSSIAAAQDALIVIRYHITTAPKGQPLAPRLDVVALDAVDANNIWSVGPAPTVDLAANATLTTTAVLGNLTVGRITVLNSIPGNYVPAFESAVRLSIPLQAQTLEAPTTLTATHGQSIVDTENLQLIGTTAPTLPLAYVVTSTAIVYIGTPAPFSAPTLTFLTAIPPTLRAPLHQTAQAFASGAADPSDPRAIASAIETAMRTQWTLTTSPQPSLHRLQPTPAGDAAVLSLLTTHRGDAYAWDTTYALLLRAEGIPTRLMEGYLPGTYDRVTGDQVISAADASYWPQAALDDSGWATLDPIAHLQPVSASGANSGGTTPGGHPKAAKTPTSGGTSGSAQHAPATPIPTRSASAQTLPPPPLIPPAVAHRVGLSGAWLLLVAIVLSLSGAALLLWRAWLRRTATHPRRVVRPIRRLVYLARVLGVPGVERAKTTAQVLRAITRAVAGPDALADRLTTIYTTAVYAPPSVQLTLPDVQIAARSAARLSRALIYTRLTRRSTRPTRPTRPTSTRSSRS